MPFVSHRSSNLPMLLLFSLAFLHILVATNYASPLAPALYIFGDSVFDNGNNNLLPTFFRANYPPYGMNFINGATGRFTNGKTIADFVAEYLGLPHAPPYTSDPKLDKPTGLNYASGSCGILPETGSIFGVCLHIDKQLEMFEETVTKELPKHFTDSNDLALHLSKSIFLISLGTNDYIDNYLQPQAHNSSRLYSPEAFAELLISILSQHLQRLYRLGARKIIIFGVGSLGCLPSIRQKYKQNGECVEHVNEIVSYFNRHLPTMLENLTSSHEGSYFIRGNGDNFNANNASTYGFLETQNPCCRTWDCVTSTCKPLVKPCPQIDETLFWDGYHVNEVGSSLVATACFNGSSVCVPLNIKQLVAK